MEAKPLWQIFFSTLGGTLVGFFLALATTAYRERPRLNVRVFGPKERVYVTEKTPDSGRWSYCVTTPENATEVVLSVQLAVVNGSASYDSVIDVHLGIEELRIPARSRADAGFDGANVPPRQAVTRRVRFFIPKSGTPSRDGLVFAGPDWVWQETTSFPQMTLHWTSVRRSFLNRRVSGIIVLDEKWMTLHQPGTDIGYLHSVRG